MATSVTTVTATEANTAVAVATAATAAEKSIAAAETSVPKGDTPTAASNNCNNDDDDDDDGDDSDEQHSGNNRWSRNAFGERCLPPSRNGKFTAEETQEVRAAIEDYCAAHSISPSVLCSECKHKQKGAWMEIARRLPHRTVQSVYRHGLRQLHPFQRGPWTPTECSKLLHMVQTHGKKWSVIQGQLGRSADSCRDKHREMSCEYLRGRWTHGEVEKLQALIREHVRADASAKLSDLIDLVETQKVPLSWSAISKRMGKRSRLSCFKKWTKMTNARAQRQRQQVRTQQDNQKLANTNNNKEEEECNEDGDCQDENMADSAAPVPASPCKTATSTETTTTTTIAKTNVFAVSASNDGTRGLLALTTTNLPLASPPPQQKQQHSHPTDAQEPYANHQDQFLLSALASSGAFSETDIDWNSMPFHNGRANERWKEMLAEWGGDPDTTTATTHAPLAEVAQHLLSQITMTNHGDVMGVDVDVDDIVETAQKAAETVEAVDLPPAEILQASSKAVLT